MRGSQLLAIAFIALACLLIIGLDGLNVWRQRADTLREAVETTSNLARSLGQHAEDTLKSADVSLLGAIQRLEIDGTDAETLQKLRQIMDTRRRNFPALATYVVVDATGKCLITALPAVPAGCDLAGRPDFQYYRSHNDRGLNLGAPAATGTAATLVIPVSRRFNLPDGSFGGIVEIGISVDYLQNFYIGFDIGEQGAIWLANADGTLLARRPRSVSNVGRNLRDSAIFRHYLPQNPIGVAIVKSSVDGVVRINSYRRLAAYPLVISVALSRHEVLAPWEADAVAHLSITLALVAAVAGLGAWLTMQIRKHRELEETYRETAAAFRLLAENSTDMVAHYGPDMRRLYVSPASRELLGYDPEELLGDRPDRIVFPADRERWEEAFGAEGSPHAADTKLTYRAVRKDDRVIWIEVHRRRLASGEGFVATARDVTARVEAEEQLAEANRQLELVAMEDGLTALANRRRFDTALGRELRRAGRDGTPLSLVMLDVDHFKRFNDRYGHASGDACLQQVAGAIKDVAGRPGDLVARYGGEEFAIVLPNTSEEGACVIAERARFAIRTLALAHEGNGAKIVTISLGVATLMPQADLVDPEALIRAADAALYLAKEGGRDRVCRASDPRIATSEAEASPVHAE